MIVIGIIIARVQTMALNAGKHKTGDFIIRLLITGIGFILGGIVLVLKYI